MDPAGSLLAKITGCVADIDLGRKCFTINGREHEGRIFYEEGISTASKAFNEFLLPQTPKPLSNLITPIQSRNFNFVMKPIRIQRAA